MKVYLSPPFGNYYKLINNFLKINTIPIIGSYALNDQKNILKERIKTIRFNKEYNGWEHNVEFKNMGLLKGCDDYNKIKLLNNNIIMSINFINLEDIKLTKHFLPDDTNLELNLNTRKYSVQKYLDSHLDIFLSNNGYAPIIKLPHNIKLREVDLLYNAGFKNFHCSNSNYINNKMISGESLIAQNIKTISQLKERYCGEIEIIGGGGIMETKDIEKYINAGADHISISSICFNIFKAMQISI